MTYDNKHMHSQPKIIHQTLRGDKRSRSRSRSKSAHRSKSRKSIKTADGGVMCGKCVQTHGPKVKTRKKRLSSAKPTEAMSSVQPT